MPCSECALLDISRRNFLRVGALNLAGIGLSQFSAAAESPARDRR
jgi:hypothetical protein